MRARTDHAPHHEDDKAADSLRPLCVVCPGYGVRSVSRPFRRFGTVPLPVRGAFLGWPRSGFGLPVGISAASRPPSDPLRSGHRWTLDPSQGSHRFRNTPFAEGGGVGRNRRSAATIVGDRVV